MKTGKIAASIILLLIGCTIIAGIYFVIDYNSAVNNSGDPDNIHEIIIEEGETIDQIAKRLKELGIIENELYFKIYVLRAGIADKLQAGAFKIPENLSLEELGDILQNAEIPDIWVTVPEGLMATEIADIIGEAFSANPQSSFDTATFSEMITTNDPSTSIDLPIPAGKPLEGFLFPDTYRFPPDATAEYVQHAMLENFRTKLYEPHMQDIEQSRYSLYELVTLASILERETKHSQDRPNVADILLRRLENGWALQADATTLYYFGDWTHNITAADLEIDSPYNTRKYTGLTPTPIANPGEETFRAALFPQSNEYWYYISDADGNLHYAVTLEEHNQNIQTYLQ